MNASELLLQSTEQYAALVAVLTNKTEEQGEVYEFQTVYQQSRQKIGTYVSIVEEIIIV